MSKYYKVSWYSGFEDDLDPFSIYLFPFDSRIRLSKSPILRNCSYIDYFRDLDEDFSTYVLSIQAGKWDI